MLAKKRFSTALVWYHRKEQMPAEGHRILVFSPAYKETDPMRIRVIDSQFLAISKDAEWWAYINVPK